MDRSEWKCNIREGVESVNKSGDTRRSRRMSRSAYMKDDKCPLRLLCYPECEFVALSKAGLANIATGYFIAIV